MASVILVSYGESVARRGAIVVARSPRSLRTLKLRAPRTDGSHAMRTALRALNRPRHCASTLAERRTPLIDAARRMREEGVGCVVVVDATAAMPKVAGMLTDRDIVTAVVAGGGCAAYQGRAGQTVAQPGGSMRR